MTSEVLLAKNQENVQLEEGVCDLEHEDMRVVMLVADQDAFTRPSQTMFLVMFFQPL